MKSLHTRWICARFKTIPGKPHITACAATYCLKNCFRTEWRELFLFLARGSLFEQKVSNFKKNVFANIVIALFCKYSYEKNFFGKNLIKSIDLLYIKPNVYAMKSPLIMHSAAQAEVCHKMHWAKHYRGWTIIYIFRNLIFASAHP